MPDKTYTLFVMSDVHLIGNATHRDLEQFRSTFLPDITAAVEATSGEVFSLSLGDMTTDSRWYHDNFALPEYLREFRTYPSAIYHIMGNHDNDPEACGTTDEELERFGALSQIHRADLLFAQYRGCALCYAGQHCRYGQVQV